MIELGDGWAIDADELQYMLGREKPSKRKDTGKTHYVWRYFYTSLDQALYKYVTIMERGYEGGTQARTATEAAEMVRRTHEETLARLQALAESFEKKLKEE